MSGLGKEVLISARSRLNAPFKHHFKPYNLCDYGQCTVDECMERGMDSQGYDCSGLGIASLCDALGLPTSEWPRELRHAYQLSKLATEGVPDAGDFSLFFTGDDRIHLGIATDTIRVVHASGLTNIVEEGIVTNRDAPLEASKFIAVESLVKILGLRHG